MLEAAGWPEQDGALSRVAKHLGLPHSTLRGWALGIHNPPPSKVRDEKRIDLRQAIRDELEAIFNDPDLAEVRAEASYKDRMTAAAILIDKDQLLDGKPTQRIETVQTWLDSLPQDEYDDVIAEAERIIHAGGGADFGAAQGTAE